MVKFITFSGADEYTSASELLNFLFYASGNLCPNFNPLEVAIQVEGAKASFGTARYWWLRNLYAVTKFISFHFNFALHINRDWADKFYRGELDEDLNTFLSLRTSSTCKPFIGRVQVNFPDKENVIFNAEKVSKLMSKFQEIDFIFQYNEKSAPYINQLYEYDSNFACLLDSSCGNGILPKSWKLPNYAGVMFGFAGGLSALTIREQLPKMLGILPNNSDFWFDAESGLKDDKQHFSLSKCAEYLDEIRKVLSFSC